MAFWYSTRQTRSVASQLSLLCSPLLQILSTDHIQCIHKSNMAAGHTDTGTRGHDCIRVRDRFVIYCLKQWFIVPINPIFTMGKSWTPIDCHCKNFNSLILSSHTWNIVKKCPSWIYRQWKSNLDTSWQWKSNLDTSWQCFMCKNHCFKNKPQTDPSPWYVDTLIKLYTFLGHPRAHVIIVVFWLHDVINHWRI